MNKTTTGKPMASKMLKIGYEALSSYLEGNIRCKGLNVFSNILKQP
jgi:hypothetical protein